MGAISENQLQQILESSKMLNAQLERGELLSLVLSKAMSVVNAEAGTLWLVTEDKKLAPVEVQGIKKELMGKMVLQSGEGLAGKVVAKNEPILVEKVSTEDGWASRFDKETGFKTRSILCIPLRADNNIIGCLQLVNKANQEWFVLEDLELATFFAGHAAVALENSRLYNENQKLVESVIYVMASALDAREPYAGKHSERITKVSIKIGEGLNLAKSDLKILEWTALLHDIGKIGISDTILLQPGTLSENEWKTIKKHPEIGYKILKDLRPVHLADIISAGVLSHHERYDGKGYPYGLKGSQIPLYSRIICVADAFDAITSDRPYRKKSSKESAVEEIIRCSGSQFDPKIVKVFLDNKIYMN